ncbi:MAG: Ig-like domain-containing protein [Clostridia bacterium]|nr:Ig-like domain-containing protein [Clostridia bacterium]
MKIRNSKIIKILIISMSILLLTQTAIFAHSGRTDSKGGHKDNKNKSGLGSYHYHCGGYPAHLHKNGVCPYKSSSSSSKSNSKKSSSSSKSSSKKSSSNSKSSTSKSQTSKPTTNTTTKSSQANSTETTKLPETNSAKTATDSPVTKQPKTTTESSAKKQAETTSKPETILVTSVKIENKTTTILEKGKELNLTATVEPVNATNKTITWSSSNNNIATIDSTGKVSALENGTVTIIARSDNGKEDSFELEIKNPVSEVESVTLEGIKEPFRESDFYRFISGLMQKICRTKILAQIFIL